MNGQFKEETSAGQICAVCGEPVKRGKYCEKHLFSVTAPETKIMRPKPPVWEIKMAFPLRTRADAGKN